MLTEPIFKILALDHRENIIDVVLEIDRHNPIFEGHFPGQPVVPGACMLQLVKDVLADALNRPVRLIIAENIKFLSLLEPATDTVLHLSIDYQLADSEIKVTANLTAGETVCMKLQGVFQ